MVALRWRELWLLLIVWLAFVVGWAGETFAQAGKPVSDWLRTPIYFTCLLLLVHIALIVLRFRGDQALLPLVGLLSGISLIVLNYLEPSQERAQLGWLALGLVLMLAVVFGLRDVGLLQRYKYTAAALGIALLVVTAVFGREINGARLWLGVGPFQFQPSELMKLLLVIFMAAYLEERREVLARADYRWATLKLSPWPYLVPLLLLWGLSLLLLLWQKDLGATVLMLGIALSMMYVATGRKTFVGAGLLLLAVNVLVTYKLFGYVHQRIEVWLHPWELATGPSYQIVQALYAIANGGASGTGLGRGHPGFIPFASTDFIFAATAEQLGFAGMLAVLAIYLTLVLKSLQIGLAQPTTFAQLLGVGCAMVLALQCLVIVAGNLSLIPLTGITLPFVSYGGSSLVVNFLLLGILLRLSAQRPASR
ncbi:MAG TPA: FtsW/RodA/SpoVE family cell cycle protein [Chloroflexota bacterium]|nr:FtsW/RodA/SpoVE family cell cycle protein [Chloroflexota bacterium]